MITSCVEWNLYPYLYLFRFCDSNVSLRVLDSNYVYKLSKSFRVITFLFECRRANNRAAAIITR